MPSSGTDDEDKAEFVFKFDGEQDIEERPDAPDELPPKTVTRDGAAFG